MSKTKSKTKNKKNIEKKDFYAVVKIDAVVYFQAADEEDAKEVGEQVLETLDIRVDHKASESIDYDGHEVLEIHEHK